MLQKTIQNWIRHSIQYQILDVAVHVAWHKRYLLYQVVVSETDNGWRAVVKAHKGKRFYCAFVETDTYHETLEVVGYFAAKGCFDWKDDQWPTKFIKKRVGIV